MSVIFLQPNWRYDSYEDFWRLVELSEFEIRPLSQIDPTANDVYVFTPHNGQFMEVVRSFGDGWAKRRCRIVWWMLERPDNPSAPPFDSRVDSLMPLVDACWVSDRWVATLHPRCTHAVLGGHADLGSLIRTGPAYDFAHLSYAWGRRENLYHALIARGLREAPNGFGLERARILQKTRLIVSAHQYPAKTIAPLRFAVAAAHGIPVLTEDVNDPFPHTGEDIMQASFDALPDAAVKLLQDPIRCLDLGWAIKRRLCEEWTFRRGVEEAVTRTIWEPR